MAEKSESGPYDRIDSASARMRAATTWLAVAFGAVASAAFTGFTLSDLGEFSYADDPARFVLAACAIGVAAVLLGYGLVLIAALNSMGRLSATELRSPETIKARIPLAKPVAVGLEEVLTKDNGWTAGREDVAGLIEDYVEAQKEFFDALGTYIPKAGTQAANNELQAKRNRYVLFQEQLRHLVVVASAERLRVAFDLARVRIGLSFSAAIILVVVFVWAANPPGTASTEFLSAPPVPATLELSAAVQPEFRPILGSSCNLSEIRVQVLGKNDDVYDVVTVESPTCPVSARISVSENVGVLTFG